MNRPMDRVERANKRNDERKQLHARAKGDTPARCPNSALFSIASQAIAEALATEPSAEYNLQALQVSVWTEQAVSPTTFIRIALKLKRFKDKRVVTKDLTEHELTRDYGAIHERLVKVGKELLK